MLYPFRFDEAVQNAGLALEFAHPDREGRGELAGPAGDEFHHCGEVSFLRVRCLERDQTMLQFVLGSVVLFVVGNLTV